MKPLNRDTPKWEYEERTSIGFHRNVEALRRREAVATPSNEVPQPEPTLEDVRRDYQPREVQEDEDVTELVGECLWDMFADHHDVIAADERVADIGSFRGASAFLDECVNGHAGDATWREGDDMRFYMGTIWISGRADLTPVYVMIFRRIRLLAADWVYHFPELQLVDLGALGTDTEKPTRYSPARHRSCISRGIRTQSPRLATRVRQFSARTEDRVRDALPIKHE